MSGSHTPGPWGYAANSLRGYFHIADGEGAILAMRADWPERAEESAANARLIASAPDMAAALLDIALKADLAASMCDNLGRALGFSEIGELARAAIAKASPALTGKGVGGE